MGDIRAASIFIEGGAYFKGSTDISKPEVGRLAAGGRGAATPAGGQPTESQTSLADG